MKLRVESLVLGVVFSAAVAVVACDARTALDPGPGATEVTTGSPESNATTATEIQADLLARWNAAASASGSAFDFHWGAFDQFPHPTYKGGSVQAYQAFATVLLAFFRQGDDFDFLAANQLFTMRLVYVFPSGQNGLDTTFEELATTFAAPGAYGAVPDDTRQALKEYADRM